jgi:hypothetical protein
MAVSRGAHLDAKLRSSSALSSVQLQPILSQLVVFSEPGSEPRQDGPEEHANALFRQESLYVTCGLEHFHSYCGLVRVGYVQAFFDGMPASSALFLSTSTVLLRPLGRRLRGSLEQYHGHWHCHYQTYSDTGDQIRRVVVRGCHASPAEEQQHAHEDRNKSMVIPA